MGIHMGRNNHIQTQNAALELMNLQNQLMKNEILYSLNLNQTAWRWK